VALIFEQTITNKPLFVVTISSRVSTWSNVYSALMSLSNNLETSLLLHTNGSPIGSMSSRSYLGGLPNSPISGHVGERMSSYLGAFATCPSPILISHSSPEPSVNGMHCDLMAITVTDTCYVHEGTTGIAGRICDSDIAHVYYERSPFCSSLVSHLFINNQVTS